MTVDPFFYPQLLRSKIVVYCSSRSITSLKILFEKQGNNRENGLPPQKRHSGNSEGAADLLYQGTVLTNLTEAILIRQEMKNSSLQAG